jgi:DNA-3-methyladenine glycosylase
MNRKLALKFYQRPADRVAEDLVGTTLVHRLKDGSEYRARVVETEAYLGSTDLACHASKGLTKRTTVLLGPAGHAYVYLIYGMYTMLNVTCGDGHAVLIRAAEPLNGWPADLSGPGKLARAFQITLVQNGLILTADELFFTAAKGEPPRITRSKRIGIDYAGDWKHALLRYFDADSQAVSKPRS